VKKSDTCVGNEPFALMVLGDDMAPDFINGAVIVVDLSEPLVNGAYVVIATAEDVFFRQYVQENGKSCLRALSSEVADIQLADGWQLKGVVVQSRYNGQTCFYEYENGKVQKYVKRRGRRNSLK